MSVRTGYARSESIPYRWALLDSWWYGEYAHNGSGMYSWDESSAKEPVNTGALLNLHRLPDPEKCPCFVAGQAQSRRQIPERAGRCSQQAWRQGRDGLVHPAHGEVALRHTLCTRTNAELPLHRLTGRTATPNRFPPHNLLTACFGCWQASNPEWDWKVYERNGSPNSSFSAAWSDSREFYDSLFANATDWVSPTILLKSLGCVYTSHSRQ